MVPGGECKFQNAWLVLVIFERLALIAVLLSTQVLFVGFFRSEI